MVISLCHLLLDQFLMRPPVGLHQHTIDVGDGHHYFGLSGRFDQAAITEIAAQSQVTLGGTQDQLDGGGKGTTWTPGHYVDTHNSDPKASTWANTRPPP
jgi:hypothetical protein